MRIAVVTESFLPAVNGVTNSVCRILEHFAVRGHQAMVVTPESERAGSIPACYAGHPVIGVTGMTLPGYRSFVLGLPTTRLERILADFAPDVVHLASPVSLGAAGGTAARKLAIPSVAVFQTDVAGFARRYGFRGADRAIWRWLRHVHRQADRTLVPSSATYDQLRDHGIERLAMWRRGVDTVRFDPRHRSPELRDALLAGGGQQTDQQGDRRAGDRRQLDDRRQLGDRWEVGDRREVGHRRQRDDRRRVGDRRQLDDRRELGDRREVGDRQEVGGRRELGDRREVIVGYVGRLAGDKRVHLLRHVADLPGVQLVVVGDGPAAPRLREQLPLAVFPGFLAGQELSTLYASLDVFVHTGADETFCQAIQEAMASGVPVVAPAAGGPLDLVVPGRTGLFYAPDSAHELRAAVGHLVEQPELRAAYGRRARATVLDRTWQRVGDELLGHYADLLNQARMDTGLAG